MDNCRSRYNVSMFTAAVYLSSISIIASISFVPRTEPPQPGEHRVSTEL